MRQEAGVEPETLGEEILSIERIKAMQQRRIKKHDSAGVLLHWFNAACWLFLVATGLATVNNPAYAIVPLEWTRLMRSVFGGTSSLIFWHAAVGLLWAGVLLVHIVFGWRTLTVPFLKNNFWMDRDDVLWLIRRAQRILGKNVKLPPQGPYNAGQKIFGIIVTFGSMTILLSGLALAFRSYMPGTAWVAWALPVHLFAVGVVCAGLCIHIYMGGVFPEEKQAFFSIFTGEVNELYAYLHHRKWYDEVKKEEAEWEERLREKRSETHVQVSEELEEPDLESDSPLPDAPVVREKDVTEKK
jgi:formate dehydrogenase subunit gamma